MGIEQSIKRNMATAKYCSAPSPRHCNACLPAACRPVRPHQSVVVCEGITTKRQRAGDHVLCKYEHPLCSVRFNFVMYWGCLSIRNPVLISETYKSISNRFTSLEILYITKYLTEFIIEHCVLPLFAS
jgi:hypothetical protein